MKQILAVVPPVEEHFLQATSRARPADRIARGPGFHQAHGEKARRLERGEAAARGHQVERAGEAAALELGCQPLQVARHERLHVGVGAGRGEALVFADFRANGRGERDGDVWQRLREQCRRALFVRVVRVGVQKADGDGLDVSRFQDFRNVENLFFLQGRVHPALRGHPLGHRKAQFTRHQRRGSAQVVVLVALLVAHSTSRKPAVVSGAVLAPFLSGSARWWRGWPCTSTPTSRARARPCAAPC